MEVIFSDVNPLVASSSSKELVVNEDAINVSLEMIFTTPYKSRPFRRTFGTILHELLWEPLSDITAQRMLKEFKDAIDKWEPNISDVSSNIVPDYTNQSYYVSVTYRIPKLGNKLASYSFNVSRQT